MKHLVTVLGVGAAWLLLEAVPFFPVTPRLDAVVTGLLILGLLVRTENRR